MTVQTEATLSGPYTPNGSTTVFPFSFAARSTGEIQVLIDGAVVSPSLYNVALAADFNSGSVTFTIAPTGLKLYIFSDPSFEQAVSLGNQSAFLPKVIEAAFDRTAIRDQKLKEGIDRALKVPVGTKPADLIGPGYITIAPDGTISVVEGGAELSPGSLATVAQMIATAAGSINAAIAALTTTNIAEGARLYFTATRARGALSGSSTVTLNQATGQLTITKQQADTAAGFTLYQTQGSSTATVSNGVVSISPANLAAAAGGAVLTVNGGTLVQPLIAAANPTDPLGVATKQYVDSVAQGYQPKAPVAAATTGNITSLYGTMTIDGVALSVGQRILVKDQTAQQDNGIYVVSATAWNRATDMDVWSEVQGAATLVQAGTVNAGSTFAATVIAGGTVGTTAIPFVQTDTATSYSATGGVQRIGSQFSLTPGVAALQGSTNSFIGPQNFQYIKIYQAGVDIDLPEGVDAGHSFTRTTFINNIARTQAIVGSDGRFARKSYDASGAFLRVSYQVDPTTGLMQSEHRAPQTANEPVTLGNQQSAAGAQNTGYQHPSTGGGLRTVYARFREDPKVTDFYDGVPQNLHPYSRLAGGDFVNTFDDTPYFQKAVDACASLNISGLKIPSSFYRVGCDGTSLRINTSLDLQGDGYSEGGSFGGRVIGFSEPARGTWIKAGMTAAPAIIIESGYARGTKISRIGFTQDHPNPGPGWAPTNHDYLISLVWNAGAYGQSQIMIDDVMLLGINKGINARKTGRFWIGKIYSQAFRELLTLDYSLDRCEFGSIHDWGFWNGGNNVYGWQQANRDLINIGRCDGLKIGSLFSICGRTGIQFFDSGLGSCTTFRMDYGYLDLTATGVSVASGSGMDLRFGTLGVQGENVNNIGHGLSGSRAVSIVANGNIVDIDHLSASRQASYGIYNSSNTTVHLGTSALGDAPDGPMAWYSPTVPINASWAVQKIGTGYLDGDPLQINYAKTRLNP